MSSPRTYSEMIKFNDLKSRFEYLKLSGDVGSDIWGSMRAYNQKFYNSYEWRITRNKVILRDDGCELGIRDVPIIGKIIVHHIEPITYEDIVESSDKLLDLDNLICVGEIMHKAITLGNMDLFLETIQNDCIRTEGDTCPWKIR